MARSSGGRLPGRPAGRALHQPEECAISSFPHDPGRHRIGYASSVIVLLGAGAWTKEEVWGAWRAEARLRRTQFRRARDYANDFLKQWSEVADSYTLEASDIRTKLDRLKSDYLALQSSFDEEIRRLEQEKECTAPGFLDTSGGCQSIGLLPD
jgi:hypothetical protein